MVVCDVKERCSFEGVLRVWICWLHARSERPILGRGFVCVCLCILDANDQAIRRTLGEVRRYDDSEVKWMGHQSVYLHLRTAPPNITTSTAIWRIRFYRPIRYAYMNLSRRGYDYSVLIYDDADFNKLRPMLLNLYTWLTNELKLTK